MSKLSQYALAVLTVAAGLVARAALGWAGGHHAPYVALIPFLVLATFYLGLGPGIFAAICFAAGTRVWPLPDRAAWEWESWATFVLGAGVVTLISAVASRRRDQALGAEQTISARARELEAILNCVGEPVTVFDDQGRPIKGNAASADSFGRDLAGLDGEQLRQRHEELCIRRRDGQRLTLDELPSRRALRGEGMCHEELIYRCGGQDVVFEVTSAPLREGERIVGAVVVCHDITRRLKAEEHAHDARTAAEEANAAKDRFLAVLSHELRNPLMPVVLVAEGIETDERLPAEVRQDAQMIRRNVELQRRLIDDLLDVTRIARGKMTLRMQEVDLIRVARDTLAMFAGELEQAKLELRVELEQAPAAINGDGARLAQVFWNLLRNAIKFTPPGGRITVRSRVVESPPPKRGAEKELAAGSYVEMEVSDTGRGIKAEVLARLFEPFAQGEPGGGGLGLGLAICRSIVRQHGGEIRAESEGMGKGANIRLWLPLADKDVAQEPEKQEERSRREAAKGKLLLVEDHADTAKLVRRLLSARGYEVETAGTVAEARELVRRKHFDLLISDLGLPDGTGYDLLRDLGEGRMKAIALSGYTELEDAERARQAGFAEHLVKPVQMPKLTEAIERVMAGTNGQRRPTRAAGVEDPGAEGLRGEMTRAVACEVAALI